MGRPPTTVFVFSTRATRDEKTNSLSLRWHTLWFSSRVWVLVFCSPSPVLQQRPLTVSARLLVYYRSSPVPWQDPLVSSARMRARRSFLGSVAWTLYWLR